MGPNGSGTAPADFLRKECEAGRPEAAWEAMEDEVDAPDETGWSSLMMAAAGGHETVVRILLMREGVDVNRRDVDGWTALMIAAHKGHVGVVRLLLSVRGIERDARDVDGLTARDVAERRGHMHVVDMLR